MDVALCTGKNPDKTDLSFLVSITGNLNVIGYKNILYSYALTTLEEQFGEEPQMDGKAGCPHTNCAIFTFILPCILHL